MADNKQIVVKIVNEGGGTGGTGNARTGSKQSLSDLEKEAKLTGSSVEQRRLLNKAVKESAKLYGDNSSKTLKLKKSLEDASRAAREFGRIGKESSNTFGKAIGSYQFKFNALGNIISNLTSTIVRGFVQAIKSSISTVAEFESAMAGVRAIAEATDEQFKRLRDDAIRLGGATIFTARQVAELQTAYAKLGFTTEEILNATEATLDLAAATDEDLGSAARVTGTTLRAFAMDASEMQRVVDTMAKSFTSSALDLEKFRESMKFLAPVAKQAGFSIEETTALLAKLADTGLSGSLAGTSLRNIFLRMADGSSKLAKSVGGAKRGLDGFVELLTTLRDRGTGLAEALQLTDRRAVTAFATLIGSIDDIKRLDNILDNATGTAKEMASIRMDTFKGSVTILKSAWEGFVLSFESGTGVITKGLRSIVDLTTTLVNGMKRLTMTYDELVKNTAGQKARDLLDSFNKKIKESGDDRIAAIEKEISKRKELIAATEGVDRDLVEYNKELSILDIRARAVSGKAIEANKQALESNRQYLSILEGQLKAEIERREQSAEEEELLRKQQQRERDQERAKELEDYNKFLDKRQKALDAAENIRISAIKNATVESVEKENFRHRVQLRMLQKYLDDGLLKHHEYFNALGDAYREHQKNIIGIVSDGIEKQAKTQADAANRGKKLVLATITSTQEELDKATTLDPNQAPSMWDKILGSMEFTSEQETAIKRGISFVVDQLDYLADKQKEYADIAVENSERKVNQLQRDLEIELQLAEQGFANNVSLRQEELASAKATQAKALAQQEAALKRQEQLEAVSQGINLTSAVAGILKSTFTSMDPLTALLVSAGAATAMMGAFSLWKNNIKAETQSFGDGGEINGPKHSQGGVKIEAEGGEYMVNAEQYAKYKDLVVAINEDKVSQAWAGLNKDLNVNTDNSDMIGAMNKYWGTKVDHYNGYRVERSGNRIRKIYA